MNASCEKLPSAKLILNSRNKNSNSIIISTKKHETADGSQVKPYNDNDACIPRNKSNLSLSDSHRQDLLEHSNSLLVSRLKPKAIYQKELNRTLEDEKPYFKRDRRSTNAMRKNPTIAYTSSSQHRIHQDNDSTTLSGLSMRDEWTEIELYNGILGKMRKDHEVQTKRNKIQEIRNTLKEQVIQRKEVQKRELEEKEHFDKMVAKTVNNDIREGDRIRLERQRKIDEERNLRDEQLYLEHRKKAMYAEEKRNYENSLVEKLQKEIKEEKDNAVNKRKKELTECRKLITENEVAKAEVVKKKKIQKEEDAAALIRYEKLLEEQEIKRKLEIEKREERMQARMNKMKETVIDRQDKKEKEEELRLLRAVQARENREEIKERSNKMKLDQEITRLRQFLAQQVNEKRQTKEFEKHKNSMFIKQVLEKDDQERQEEREKFEKRKQEEEQCHKFLETQMNEKHQKAFGMTGDEFLMNKKLLKEISEVKKKIKNNNKDVFDVQALKPF